MCSHSGGESNPLQLPVDLTHSALRTSSPVHEAILAGKTSMLRLLTFSHGAFYCNRVLSLVDALCSDRITVVLRTSD